MEKILKPFFEEDSSYREIPIAYLTYITTGSTPETITITGYTGPVPMGKVSIPAQINGIPVTAIADGTYPNGVFENKGLTGVIIPNSVTYIGECAFAENQLTSVTFMGSGVSPLPTDFTNNIGNLGTIYTGAGTYTFNGATWTKM